MYLEPPSPSLRNEVALGVLIEVLTNSNILLTKSFVMLTKSMKVLMNSILALSSSIGGVSPGAVVAEIEERGCARFVLDPVCCLFSGVGFSIWGFGFRVQGSARKV